MFVGFTIAAWLREYQITAQAPQTTEHTLQNLQHGEPAVATRLQPHESLHESTCRTNYGWLRVQLGTNPRDNTFFFYDSISVKAK